jgi:hypothetical protein
VNEWMDWGKIAVIVVGFLFGLYFQRRDYAHLDKRMDDFRDLMNRRLDALEKLFTEKLDRVADLVHVRLDSHEERITKLEGKP